MLEAELKGHGIPEAMASEDYLTSTVFGLLTYLDSVRFWGKLFLRAVKPGSGQERASGTLRLHDFGQVEAVETCFWERHGDAIPDLTIRFLRNRKPLLQLIIEVKLNAEKGDAGNPESDQLVRYAKIANALSTVATPALLFFLTRGDPLPDIKESIQLLCSERETAERIFGIQWGDVHEACVEAHDSDTSTSMEKRVFADLAHYLSKRNLDYFTRFHHRVGLHHISARSLFASQPESVFGELPLSHLGNIRRLSDASQ